MHDKRIGNLLVILLATGATAALAQEQSTDGFKWGADVRLRHDSSINSYLADADPPGYKYSFERLRLREWNTLSPRAGTEFNLRLAWEGRHYFQPGSKEEWDKSEIVFDNLNGKFKLQEIPATLIVGRQDMVFADGWLVSDGTPLDGPRTNYFDAVRTTIEMQQGKSTLDLIYIDQAASPDRWLRPLYSKSKPLMEQNERGAIAYFSNRSIARTHLDAYFIYKHDAAVLPSGDSGEVYTLGGRLARDFDSHFAGRVEGAYQFGKRRNAAMFPRLFASQNDSLSAWGFDSRLTYRFLDALKSQSWLGYEVLSGNDAGDTGNHQFDPLWGRWAKYSELFPNDLDRPGDRSNLQRINLGYQVEPARGLSIQANYQALFAYANRNSSTPGFSDHSSFKGHLLTAILRYRLDRSWNGYLLGEYFIPGSYYDTPAGGGSLATRRDPAAFLRAEIVYTFQ